MQDGSAGNVVLGLIGSGVSGLFLLAIGLFNGSAFARSARAYRRARHGAAVHPRHLEPQGLVARLLARPLARVRRPRNIYVIGFLFGLGFDTATTIGLLMMTTAASLAGVQPFTLLALPLAFAAAMTLCDSLNGLAMMRMYRSAFDDPQRMMGFNALVTGIPRSRHCSLPSSPWVALSTPPSPWTIPLRHGLDRWTSGTPASCSWRCCWPSGVGPYFGGNGDPAHLVPVLPSEDSARRRFH